MSQTPFGEVTLTTEGIRMPMRFPGQYADIESGINYNYFRDYDSSTGRYMRPDPIGLRGGPNSYTYVYNSPMNTIDPFGLADSFSELMDTNGDVDQRLDAQELPDVVIMDRVIPGGTTERSRNKVLNVGEWHAQLSQPTVLTRGMSFGLKIAAELNLSVQERVWTLQQQLECAQSIQLQSILVQDLKIVGSRALGPRRPLEPLWEDVGIPFNHAEYRACAWIWCPVEWAPPPLEIQE